MLKAIFFDQDGVIADTEKDGHRVAFNEAFKELGIDVYWSEEEYGDLVKIGGGKERIAYYLKKNYGKLFIEVTDSLIQDIHNIKTRLFIELIQQGKVPLRSGIRRLMKEANDKGIIIGICTTSHIKAAMNISNILLKGIQINFIIAGDMVSKKKPDPEIYIEALKKAQCEPHECIVIEDSSIGVLAATKAGIKVVATLNDYTKEDDLSRAEVVLNSLGDPGLKCKILSSKHENYRLFSDIMCIEDLINLTDDPYHT